MQQVNLNQFNYKLLKHAYQLKPFDIKGALSLTDHNPTYAISCLIPASKRPHELDLLLEDLALQDFPKNNFEVVVLNDGGGQIISQIVAKYKHNLNINYFENDVAQRVISNLRNKTIMMARGEIFLFLDDDTRIFQKDFLYEALKHFNETKAEVILVNGEPLYGLVKAKYCYLDQFSFATRCCLYRRAAMQRLGGFMADLNSYEDIELSIRAILHGLLIVKSEDLSYAHPPLYFDSMNKPLSIGQAIFQLRQKYAFFTWFLIYLNSLRFLVYAFFPTKNCQQWFKISLGVLIYPFTRKSWYY